MHWFRVLWTDTQTRHGDMNVAMGFYSSVFHFNILLVFRYQFAMNSLCSGRVAVFLCFCGRSFDTLYVRYRDANSIWVLFDCCLSHHIAWLSMGFPYI